MFSSQKKSVKPPQGHLHIPNSPAASTPRLDQSEAENDYDVSIEPNQDIEHLHQVESNGTGSKLGSLSHSLGLSRKRIIWILIGFLLGFVIYQMSVTNSSKISTPIAPVKEPKTIDTEPTTPIENKEKENEPKTEEPVKTGKEEDSPPSTSEPDKGENKPKSEDDTPKKDDDNTEKIEPTKAEKAQNNIPQSDENVKVPSPYTPALTAFNPFP